MVVPLWVEHGVHPPPPLSVGQGVEPTKFSKEEGLTGPQL